MRSPNYPAIGLGEAVNLAQAVWSKEKRSYAPMGALVQAWGYSGLSGNARTKLAALRKYGLFEENDGGDMRLSDLAMNILHNPSESEVRLAALREAATLPEVFGELQQTYPHASDDTIRSYLLTRKGFSDTGAKSCIEAFRDTQDVAKLRDVEQVTLVSLPQIQVASSLQPRNEPPPPVSPSTAANSETLFRWPLSRGIVAEVRFVGNVKAAHIDLLKQYLDVAKGAMSIDEAEDGSTNATII